MYGILLVNECCGTLGTAVNEAYFALFPMGAHVTGMTPYVSSRILVVHRYNIVLYYIDLEKI